MWIGEFAINLNPPSLQVAPGHAEAELLHQGLGVGLRGQGDGGRRHDIQHDPHRDLLGRGSGRTENTSAILIISSPSTCGGEI